MLKRVWDTMSLVESTTVAEWKTLPWATVDSVKLLATCKELSAVVKELPKEVKGWGIYNVSK